MDNQARQTRALSPTQRNLLARQRSQASSQITAAHLGKGLATVKQKVRGPLTQ